MAPVAYDPGVDATTLPGTAQDELGAPDPPDAQLDPSTDADEPDIDAALVAELDAEATATADPPAEPEPEPDQADPPELTAEQVANVEQVMALETAQGNYEKRIRKIMGPDVALVMCEACDGMGLTPPGGLDVPELAAHDDYRTCPNCAGWGEVLTGSKRPGHDAISCPTCKGFGFQALLHEHEPPLTTPGNGHHAPEYGTPAWMGDPNVGRG